MGLFGGAALGCAGGSLWSEQGSVGRCKGLWMVEEGGCYVEAVWAVIVNFADMIAVNRADDKMASEYNLEGGATLHLVLALRGGL